MCVRSCRCYTYGLLEPRWSAQIQPLLQALQMSHAAIVYSLVAHPRKHSISNQP